MNPTKKKESDTKLDCETWSEEYYEDLEYDDASSDGVEIDYTTQS